MYYDPTGHEHEANHSRGGADGSSDDGKTNGGVDSGGDKPKADSPDNNPSQRGTQPTGNNTSTTPINKGKSRPPEKGTPNSIYEQLNPDGTVKSRAFYDENGNQFCRQDFDHPHFDKKTQQSYQPHEHNYHYNEDGYRDGESSGTLPPGYNNIETN